MGVFCGLQRCRNRDLLRLHTKRNSFMLMNLRKLARLEDNRIGIDGANAFAEALKENTSLRALT